MLPLRPVPLLRRVPPVLHCCKLAGVLLTFLLIGHAEPCAAGKHVSAQADEPGLIWPVQGAVTSPFGERRFLHRHRGVDIKAPKGTPIRAAAAGTVVFSGRQSSYGRVIRISHPNGLSTVYAHNSVNFVKVGERVKAGALIGAVGRTGHATANHVHFEVRRQGRAKDPLPLLRRPHRTMLVAHRDPASDSPTRQRAER